MAIQDGGGHSRSVRTAEENAKLLEKALSNMSDAEKEVVRLALQDITSGKTEGNSLLSTLGNLEWVRTPVDFDTFVMDPYYLGNTCDTIYKVWLEDLKTLFREGYREAVFTGAIGTGKCVDLDTETFDWSSGCRKRVGDLGSYRVLSMGDDLKFRGFDATSELSGEKPCIKLTLKNGASITVSEDHKILSGDGMVRADRLEYGDRIAVPNKIKYDGPGVDATNEEIVFIACMISEYEKGYFPSSLKRISDQGIGLFRKSAKSLGFTIKPLKSKSSIERFCVEGAEGLLEKWGVSLSRSSVRVPEKFYGMSDAQVILFLKTYWEFKSHAGRRVVSVPNEGMFRDIQFLLLRLGIRSIVYKNHLFNRSNINSYMWIEVSSNEGLSLLDKLICKIPDYQRRDVCEKDDSKKIVYPVQFKNKKTKYMVGRGVKELIKEGREDLKPLIDGDLYWERIDNIEEVGIRAVADLSVPETKRFVGNGIVVHNTFAASVGICRILYILSCMRDPHRSFGIAPNSNITIACLSVNEALAVKVAYENISTKIEASPYFQENFPFEKTKKELRFPKKIWVAARASNDSSVLGLNVISGIQDETNFLPKSKKNVDPRFDVSDRAATLYNSMQRRMKSRFERKGQLPGTLFVVSSKQTPDDFTAKRVRASMTDPTIFVRDYSLWDVKPEVYTAGEWFSVVVGNEMSPSRIVKKEEDIEELKSTLPEDCVVIDVPGDFREDFDKDIEGSIRDLAGVATVSISPFIQQRNKIIEAIDPSRTHPFSSLDYDTSNLGTFYWNKLVYFDKLEGISRPILNPTAPRHIHIDPSYRNDNTGFSMGHIAGWREVVRRDDEGNKYPEIAPDIVIDLVLRIIPPIGGELILGDVRKLVYQLSKKGFIITMVTIDAWNSVDAIQKLTQKGYNAQQLSVDLSTAPYNTVKTALYESRLHYYDYPILLKELRELEYDRIKRKIDHPLNKSKDTADSVAGVVYTLTEHGDTEPIPMMSSSVKANDIWMIEQQQIVSDNRSTHIVEPDFGQMDLPPILIGWDD